MTDMPEGRASFYRDLEILGMSCKCNSSTKAKVKSSTCNGTTPCTSAELPSSRDVSANYQESSRGMLSWSGTYREAEGPRFV